MPTLVQVLRKVPESEMEPVIVNEEDVLYAVKNIDTSKLSAIDNLSAIVLEDVFLVLVRELTFMYNLSFSTAIVPKK